MSDESHDELIQIPEGQEKLGENRHGGYESIDELKSASGSHTDSGKTNNDPGSVEYHYIDDTNPPSGHQVLEESQSEANDYEDSTGTNPAYDYIQVINEPLTVTSKCKKAVRFLGPIFASVTLNSIAGFYTSLIFHTVILPRKIFFGDGEIAAETGITLNVFSALAAASCAPLMIRFDFRKVALAGSVLLICSSLTSSLTTTADILSCIMGGLAVGHLWTLGVVAIVDHLYPRQSLALIASHAGFTLGNIGSIFGLRMSDWYIDRKLFEISAVMGLIAGCCLQRTSQTQENVSKFFKHPPFYFLISIRFFTSLGLPILQAEIIIFDYTIFTFVSQLLVLTVLVIIWIFQKEKLKKSFLFSMGISVVALGLATIVYQDAFDSHQAVVASSLMLGAITYSKKYAVERVQVVLAQSGCKAYPQLRALAPSTRSPGCEWDFSQETLPCRTHHELSGEYVNTLTLHYPERQKGCSLGGEPGHSPNLCQEIRRSQTKGTENNGEPDDSILGKQARHFEGNAALYFAGVSLIIAGVGTITAAVVIKRSPPLSNETGEEDQVQDIEDRVPDQVQEIRDRVDDCVREVKQHTKDRVDEAEDHVKVRVDESETSL